MVAEVRRLILSSNTVTRIATGAEETINNSVLAANEIRLFVGARNLIGSTLGKGGPGGAGIGISYSVGSGPISVAIAAAQASYQHRRGDGPTMLTLDGDVEGDNYTFGIGTTVSNLWFDSDTNDDGTADDQATLEAAWHFDHTTTVADGKDDFYSVALHETLHALGVGGSETWEDLVSGTNWLGSEVIALNGTGTGVINPAGDHFAENLMSVRLSDGLAQKVVMDPDLLNGTRKELTQLDLAVLRDLGFSTVTAIPEPSGLFALTVAGSLIALRRRRD